MGIKEVSVQEISLSHFLIGNNLLASPSWTSQDLGHHFLPRDELVVKWQQRQGGASLSLGLNFLFLLRVPG